MKKLYLLLFLLLTCMLIGCNKTTQNNIQNQTQVPNSSHNTSEPEEDETSDEIEGPDEVVRFYKEYKRVLEENDFGIDIGNEIVKEKSSSSFSLYSYTIDFSKDNKNIAFLLFQTDEQGQIEKSGSLSYMQNISNDIIKDMITITLLVTDQTLSLSDAESIMLDMANSYNTGNDETIHESDTYFTYLWISLFENIPSVFFQHKDEINVPVDTTLYSPIEYDNFFAPLNVGEKIYISGRFGEELDYSNYFVVTTDENEEYIVTYAKPYFINVFEQNKHYIYYGEIIETRYDFPALHIHYCEPLD